MPILGIEKLFILFIESTYTYDIDKPKFLISQGIFITLFNFINVVIHNNHQFHKFHTKD